MAWYELTIRVPFEFVEPVSYLFERYAYGLSIETVPMDCAIMRSYLPSLSRTRLAHIEVGVKLAASVGDLGELDIRELDGSEDWRNSWKQHFTLLKVGRNLVVKPSWVDYEPVEGDVVIDLDPGLAFGTGYHPTTHACLEALERLVTPGCTVLDVGTGSGILTIAAAKLGAGHITAVDIDSHAVRAARKNFKRTGDSGPGERRDRQHPQGGYARADLRRGGGQHQRAGDQDCVPRGTGAAGARGCVRGLGYNRGSARGCGCRHISGGDVGGRNRATRGLDYYFLPPALMSITLMTDIHA